MKDQKLPFIRTLKLGFLSFFGTGHSPIAPGTVGSFFTLPLIYLLSYLNVSFLFLILFTLILFVIACIVADQVQKEMEVHDPGWIVIDEVIGMLVTWAFIFPRFDLKSGICLFVLFRFFDIVKIFPANYLDIKMKSGMGTIIDDVVSGLYAGLFLYGLHFAQVI